MANTSFVGPVRSKNNYKLYSTTASTGVEHDRTISDPAMDARRFYLEEWFLQNSSHVIDLAFFIGGHPTDLKSFVSAGASWHPSGTVFSGAGVTSSNALFSYNANWDSAGRWWVEFLTKENRYYHITYIVH